MLWALGDAAPDHALLAELSFVLDKEVSRAETPGHVIDVCGGVQGDISGIEKVVGVTPQRL